MYQLISGIIIAGITEGAKRIPQIPLSAGQTRRIQAVGIGLSIVSTLIAAYLNGDLNTAVQAEGFQQNIIVIVTLLGFSISTWFTSVLAYHGLIKK